MNNLNRTNELVFPAYRSRTAADYIIEYFMQIEVDTIFGIPGGAVEPLFDAISRQQRNHKSGDQIQLITSRHEAGAVFMADGYARESGRLAVCCATTGPGSTNMITGIASAYMDKIPMLILTPQTSMSSFGRHDFQDSSDDAISIVTMLSKCTRYNSMVTHVGQLKYKLMKAVKRAYTYPYGPVHLSIPMEIWDQIVEDELPDAAVSFKPKGSEGYDQESFKALCKLAADGKKLLFLLGQESLSCADEIVACAELLGAEIVTTSTAKGAVAADHPLYRGVLGFAGHRQAEDILSGDEIDHIVAIGSNLNPFETASLCDNAAVIEKMLYINHSIADGLVSELAHLQLYGSLKKIFSDFKGYLTKRQLIDNHVLSARAKGQRHLLESTGMAQSEHRNNIALTTAINQPDKQARVKPQYLMKKLPAMFSEATRYHVDAGNSWAWATHYLHLNFASNYETSMSFGSMGWAIGAAVGAACAQNKAPAVCITGDGSYLMSGQEITVAVEQQLPVIFVILNDNAYGMVKHGQRIGGAEEIGFELPAVDFAMMARAVGARGVTVKNAAALDALDIPSLLEDGGPLLLDVYIDSEEVPPMASRLKELARG